MVSEVMIPVLEQTGAEVVLLRWLKSEGDEVREGEALCEVETSKTVVEIEANAGGLLRRILVEAGTAIPPLTVVALVAKAGEPLPDIDPYYRVRQIEPQAPAPGRATAEEPRAETPARRPSPTQRIIASPRAKRLAAEHGIDLSTIQGTGPGGRILEDDVRGAVKQAPVPTTARAARAKAARVTQSWHTIPHFYMTITVDMSRIVERKSRAGDRITYTDYLALAIADALKHHPTLNGHWKDNALAIIPEVHLGLVVQTERGLVIPVLRDLHKHSLEDIAAARERLVQQAHAGKLSATAMTGATFTLSNLGAGHIDHFTAIINPPEVAILSVGSIQPRPLVAGSELVVRPTAMFTLGVDHRAIDGREAAAFLEQLKGNLEG